MKLAYSDFTIKQDSKNKANKQNNTYISFLLLCNKLPNI